MKIINNERQEQLLKTEQIYQDMLYKSNENSEFNNMNRKKWQ